MTSTDSAPRTYAQAVKVAETVTLDEFASLIAEARGSVTVFAGPRKARRYALDAMLYGVETRFAFVGFSYCKRTGYDDTSTASLNRSVFDFYNLGRVVRVAA